jgi:hypothetical protein
VRDGIADALGVNDRHPRLRWFYGQERGGPRVYGARVLFETMTVDQVVRHLEADREGPGMSDERPTWCLVCEGWGCERCKGGPGEQGLSADEKELLKLRDQLRAAKAELTRVALEWVPKQIAEKAVREAQAVVRDKILDAVMNGFMGDPRATLSTEAAVRELVRRLR